MTLPLFVSYRGNKPGNKSGAGWVVYSDIPPIVHGGELEGLCRRIEQDSGYSPGEVVIVAWQRLEADNQQLTRGEKP